LRHTLGFSDAELTNTIIDSNFALHPSMTALKALYDNGRVAIIRGVGYPNPNLSHFTSMDIWHRADPTLAKHEGWLGAYADLALIGKSGIPAIGVYNENPESFRSDKVVIPDVAASATAFAQYTFQTDARYPGDSTNQRNVWNTVYSRSFDSTSFLGQIASTGLNAVAGADKIRTSVTTYTSTVTYANNTLGVGLKMVAQLMTTIPEIELLYVTLGGFDHHSAEIGSNAAPTDRLVGQHATLLGEFSEGINTFYQDLTNHGLADQTVIMEWSEFGRRPQENASHGTDHGTTGNRFVIGNPVKGGLYGIQPSLAVTDLDGGGNPKMQVDFRAMYGTILDKWLGVDSKAVLGGSFEDVGFLG
jgi:uncharacterized protein (DUF1501 family)